MYNNQEKLLQEILRLEQENKTLNLRVQGVEVLGKVLQESQDENSKLKQAISGLKEQLTGSIVDVSQLSIRTTPSLQQTRCFLSQPEDNSPSLTESLYNNEPFEFLPSMTAAISNSGPNSATAFTVQPAPGVEFHIKDLTNGFKSIKDQSELLLQQANEMFHNITQRATSLQEKMKISERVSPLLTKLSEHVKDAKTREMLLKGLVNEEEQLKEKVLAMEHEQVSQEKVMENLKVELQNDAEELANIQHEMKIFSEAEFVSKSDISLESISSKATTSTSTSSKSSSISLQDENQAQSQSKVTITKSSCDECLETKQQLNQALKQKKEIERQKEEILDVNHAWDVQYKKLKAETAKEISDLRQQVEFFKTADNQKKFESLRNAYKKVIDDERKSKEQAMNEKVKIEEKCKALEDENRKLSLQIAAQQRKPPTSGMAYGMPATPFSSIPTQHEEQPDIVKEIEVLKQQLRVYADDFKCERQDRERMQSEKEKLEKTLKENQERVTVLEEQLRLYEEDFRKETQEKDRLRRQLLTNTRERVEPENQFGEMTRKTQAIAEHQARLRSLREQYDREERRLLKEQQDLQQRSRAMNIHPASQPSYMYQPRRAWQPEPLRARGARPPDDMFYGGDVQADNRLPGREVPDSSKQQEFICPRCYRSFLQSDIDSYSKHVEKCIE